MPVLPTTSLTLADWAKRLDPNGSISVIVEMLSQTNEILTDMQWIEGNLPTGNRATIRSGLPSVAWRLLNYGVQPSKATTVQVDDSCGMLEARSVVDCDLAKLNGNLGTFRLSEAKAFLEAMNQEMAETLFYGDTAATPEKFLGLTPRYSSTTPANGTNVILGGGVQTDNTSVWLVAWSDQTVHGIFPKGLISGLQHRDLGEVTVLDTAGGRYQAYEDLFQWKCGFTLKDWRYAVRICNIDVSSLVAESGQADLIKLMIRAINKLPSNLGTRVFYCNRTVSTMLMIQALNKSSSVFGVVPAANQFQTNFFGIPVRTVDRLRTNEALVS